VYIVGIRGGELQRLTTDGRILGAPPVISADDSTVVFVRRDQITVRDQMFVLKLGTMVATPLFNSFGPGNLSPIGLSADGRQLLFAFTESGIGRVGLIDTDGMNFQELRQLNPPFAFSGDATTVAHVTGSSTGALTFFSTENSDPAITLEPDAVSGPPSITFDGREVSYQSVLPGQPTDIYAINTNGTDRRNVTNTPAGTDSQGSPLTSYGGVVSQNGAAVAFVSTADLMVGNNSDHSREVFVMLLRPSLAIDGLAGSSRPHEDTFTFTGFGFTPNGPVTRRLRQPDGTEVTLTPAMSADANGKIMWQFPTDGNTPLGTFEAWVIDDTTGNISNVVYETVMPVGQ
jgi:Tol biopolymer transport system component